ncbi:ATP-binding protein [Usitatibacter palustris]|uniref:Bacterial transcriptional activator domain-containing protein n=1 Tax=Usitatibacter palustris TaxID=2732487 RepID=A0A6M4HA26_9PROT|nr:tetratricopeptide repeat protein [Usitatibacter palustris]QJR15563.1 hypothetical protein DSM104440_02385 [Usitatibacter palustris]
MNPALRVRLLGTPAFEAGGEPLACPSQKAVWLAAYLFMKREAVARPRLATLLWGGAGQRLELGSLRVALTKLPAPVSACLEIGRDRIGVARDASFELDVDGFIADCASSSSDAHERAIAGYGELLQGVPGDAAPEFSDWLLAERTRLRALAHGVHLKLAQRLHAQGSTSRARAVADAWLRQEPASEAMHRLLMEWLAQGGNNDQALAHYEVYRRARAVAHGAPPSDEMSAYAERLRQGRATAGREPPARIAAATSFIGRTEELAELRGLLADPSCRLVTIHGMGGVGKTRLAVAIADLEAEAFPGGIHVIALDGVREPRLFAQTVARGCGLQPAGSADPLDLAASWLRDRTALLILDNLEHLLGESGDDPQSIPAQVAALLRGTGARVKVLATSREPLRLQEEWLYALDGLAFPPEGADPTEAQSFAAVQFFAQRARQAYTGFSLPAELPSVTRLCTLLEGLPLGLELAASWVRNVPCAEIAASLATRAAQLKSFHVNRAARHNSLAAVVAYSWERLSAEQREALEGLSALVGSFPREAAGQVAHASVRALSSLAEKSLLQAAGNGRWHLHEVVRQFAWEPPDTMAKSLATRHAAILKRRDAYYRSVLGDAQATLAGEGEADALAQLELDAPNIRATWQSLAQEADTEALDAAAPAWFEFLECRCFFAEGIGAAERWLDAAQRAGHAPSAERARLMLGTFRRFASDNAGALDALTRCVSALESLDAPRDLARARAALAFTLLLAGRLDEAREQCDKARAGAEAGGDRTLIAAACRTQGLIAVHSGHLEEGRELERRALEMAVETGKPTLRAAAHNNLAMAENHLGNYAAAQAGYESALGCWRELHATANIGRAMHNLGVVATRMEDHSTALERYRAALDVLRKAGDRNLIALNLMSTGDALVRLGRPADARSPLEQALAIAERHGYMLPGLDARIVLAQAALALGETHAAASHLSAAFDGAQKHHFKNVLGDALVTAARLALALDASASATALDWSAGVARDPEISRGVRSDALRLIEDLTASREIPEGSGGVDERIAAARKLVEGARR